MRKTVVYRIKYLFYILGILTKMEYGGFGRMEMILSKLGLSEEIINSIKEKFKDEAMGGFHIWPKRKEKISNELKVEFIKNKSSLK